MNEAADRSQQVLQALRRIQQELCTAMEAADGKAVFVRDQWQRPADGAAGLEGSGCTAVLEGGAMLERGGVALSDVSGGKLPPAATARNPHLAGRSFRAQGVSVVFHPRNPHIPTSHMNVRCFGAGDVWWFGGGFDLTPFLPYEEDVVAWHRAAAAACTPLHADFYASARRRCDEYFWLKHRGEARGVGGIFYDDLNAETPAFPISWEQGLALTQRVAQQFQQAYLAIIARRGATPYGERERRYQLHRRGRYVEFNLVFDRGTHFGLQSGGRTQSILMSMPPVAEWSYVSPDSELDARLLPYLTTLRGKDWLAP
jgi:coproporphyrinogen III oxidase